MASSSSSSSHCVMSRGNSEYDLFCLRADDTRYGFTSHLIEALSREKIKPFIDDMLGTTENINELIYALQRCALSVVIFSKEFADSVWCLEQVATVSQSMENSGHRVHPVFYRVDPSDVADDSGGYAATMDRKHGGSSSPDAKKRWMNALKVVANCAGYTSEKFKDESGLVEAIVKDVLKKLVDMSPRVKYNNLIGMDARVSEVEQLLAMHVDDFRIIGLWGMGGVGKTTLAKACYQSFVSSGGEIKHLYVQDINEKCEKQYGIDGIVLEIYSMLLSENSLSLDNLNSSYKRARLSQLRVFLVLDNLETLSQLEQLLLGDIWSFTTLFAPGSRIILTTRNRRVLEIAGACIYDVKCLHFYESVHLFAIHAFKQYLVPNDWWDLSTVAVSYCNGSPLAIEVLGGALFCRDKYYWESFLCELGNIPKPEIHGVIRRSYDMLGIVEKGMFLDVACFFKRVQKYVMVQYFSTNTYRVDHLMEELIDKSLFSCSGDNGNKRIEVHDLLKEMAWSIVNEEPKLENRSRLKNADDIYKLLANRRPSSFEVGRATEGISLDVSRANEVYLEANAFEGMTSLRLLRLFYSNEDYGICKIRVPDGGLDMLPNSLRWFRWEQFPSKSLPSRFCPENLVLLALCHSRTMEICWEIQPKLVNLVVLDLSYCINLVAIPDLSGSPKLTNLHLQGCKSLIELPSHVQYLDQLVALLLEDCTNLRRLPPRLNSKFLKFVLLSSCPWVVRCPEIDSRELQVLDLTGTPVKYLPGAIYNIKQGGMLCLSGEHITSFPAISANLFCFRLQGTAIRETDCCDQQQGSLPRFARLELMDNHQLKSLSGNIWKMCSEKLVLQNCPLIESLPEISQPVDGLTELLIKGCRNLKSLPSRIDNLKSLHTLVAEETDIARLPACILELDQLSVLTLPLNRSLDFVPDNIHKLAKLSSLFLTECCKIQSLPELPPNLLVLDVSGCRSLQALPSNLGAVRWQYLSFEDCPRLDMDLPREMVNTFPNHAILCPHTQGGLQYSGSELPEWLAYISASEQNDSGVMLQLSPPNCSVTQPIKGIAFGVVCSSDIHINPMQIKCDCSIGTTMPASWSSRSFGLGLTGADNVYIWYDKNLLGEDKTVPETVEPWYVRYAGLAVSFRFYLKPGEGEDPDKFRAAKIQRVGVSLMY